MAKLEDLKRGATVKGILPDCLVTVIDVKWYGSAAIELTYKDPAGKPSVVLLYRDREPALEIADTGQPWSFDGDGKLFRLVSEAHRINLAHLFDPLLAIHTSMVDPLPHQITAAYGDASMTTESCSAWSPKRTGSTSPIYLIRCWPSILRWSIPCRIRSPPSTARCCRANRYGSFWLTIPAPARRLWPVSSSRNC